MSNLALVYSLSFFLFVWGGGVVRTGAAKQQVFVGAVVVIGSFGALALGLGRCVAPGSSCGDFAPPIVIWQSGSFWDRPSHGVGWHIKIRSKSDPKIRGVSRLDRNRIRSSRGNFEHWPAFVPGPHMAIFSSQFCALACFCGKFASGHVAILAKRGTPPKTQPF